MGDVFSHLMVSCLEWLAVNRFGASDVLHILDVFLFIADGEEQYQTDWAVQVPRGLQSTGENDRS